TKGAFPRIETGPDADRWKAKWNQGTWPFYSINFEVGYKPRVRVGNSPWLVSQNSIRHYSPDGQNWYAVGYNPLEVAAANRISLISSSRVGSGAQTEIRATAAAKIQDWKLNYEFGAEMALSGKIPGAE
ncbi:hypothetical protein, partial [Vibrio sp.]|uniref:hypothetical protein n=1 Tax=Vibrio sp. TaxID=678 RepID=UPI003D11D8FF